ncbi:hypothetical protein SVIOM74S_02025 [Streptomyces violarus]
MVEFITTRSFRPEITSHDEPSGPVIWVSRVSWPLRTKECLTSSAPMNRELASEASIRSQAYSSMRIRARWIGSWLVTK